MIDLHIQDLEVYFGRTCVIDGITPRAIDEDLMARHIQHLITTGFFPNPHLLDSQEHHD